MKVFISLVLSVVSFQSIANSTISSFKVENDTVIFKTSSTKSEPIPTCVTSTDNQIWGFSLTDESGKNLYRALLAAQSNAGAINVVSSGTCTADGYEKPASIEITK